MKHSVVKTVSWWNGYFTSQQVDKIASWEKSRLTKWPGAVNTDSCFMIIKPIMWGCNQSQYKLVKRGKLQCLLNDWLIALPSVLQNLQFCNEKCHAKKGTKHRHLSNKDCLTARSACLVCFISTVNGRSKKRSLLKLALVANT